MAEGAGKEGYMSTDLIIRDLARFVSGCCDGPGDLMYRAEGQTWWKREGLNWKHAEPPLGWTKVGEAGSLRLDAIIKLQSHMEAMKLILALEYDRIEP